MSRLSCFLLSLRDAELVAFRVSKHRPVETTDFVIVETRTAEALNFGDQSFRVFVADIEMKSILHQLVFGHLLERQTDVIPWDLRAEDVVGVPLGNFDADYLRPEFHEALGVMAVDHDGMHSGMDIRHVESPKS